MPNKQVRNSNHNRLGSKNTKKSPTALPEGKVEVTHGNAPLLTVKFLDMLLQEIKGLREDLKNG